MSIEKALADLQAAVEANTAALAALAGKAAAAPAAEETKKPVRPAKEKPADPPAAPTIDRSKVNAALEEVKEKHGVEAAKNIISKVGGAAKRADIADDKLQAVYDACKEKAEDGDEGL